LPSRSHSALSLCFVSNTASNTVTAMDAQTKRVLATIPVGKAPKRLLAVTPHSVE